MMLKLSICTFQKNISLQPLLQRAGIGSMQALFVLERKMPISPS